MAKSMLYLISLRLLIHNHHHAWLRLSFPLLAISFSYLLVSFGILPLFSKLWWLPPLLVRLTVDPTRTPSPMPIAIVGILVGIAIKTTFMSTFVYNIDVYLLHLNSALA